MLKQLLKHNPAFRAAFRFPLAMRSRWITRRPRACAALYREAVLGGDIVLAPANIDGRFHVPARSDLAVRIITGRQYEPEVTACLSRFSGLTGDIINIGANVGLLAMFLARQCPGARRIYAVEPNPEAYDCLTRNIVLNGCESRVTAVQACIGAEAGEMDFAVIPGMPEYSSIGGIVHSSVREHTRTTIRVPVSPLHLAISDPGLQPSLIVADTEGAELLVFEGATALLARHRPLLVFECSDPLLRKFGHSSKALEEFLHAQAYTVRNALAPRLPLQHPFDGEAVGIPRERVDGVLQLLA